MNLRLLLATTLLASPLLAQSNSSLWEKPFPLPTIPAGQNSATYPLPRFEWFQRVEANIQRGQAAAKGINLIFDGDSITDGWQGRGKEIWEKRYAKIGAFDFGISGDRTQHILWRLQQGQVENMKPKLVAIMIGTNNLGANTNEEIADGIKAVVADYQKRLPDAVILLQAVFPRGQAANDPARARIKAINEQISKLADGEKVIYVDFGDKFLQPDGSMSPEIMNDFLHPTPKGYQIWAEAIQPIIDKYFPPAAKQE